MAEPDIKKSWNRDDEQKPGSPPQPAYTPDGAEGSTKTAKTLSDPATGAPTGQPPETNRAESDQRPRP